MTNQISPSLISALTTLGLTTYEARVYAALVLFDQAGARDLVEYLEISKPSIYESLQRLQESGLTIRKFTRPAVFAPVHPKIALNILLESHTQAAATAGEELEQLLKKKRPDDADEAVWSVYGNAMIEHKIRDMITGADHQIECLMGERYIPLFLQTRISCPAVSLTIISQNPAFETSIKEKFKTCHAMIRVLTLPGPEYLPHPPHQNPEIDQHIDTDNILDLVVDNRESLSIPPIRTSKVSGLHSDNPVIIMMTRDRIMGLSRHLEQCQIHASYRDQ